MFTCLTVLVYLLVSYLVLLTTAVSPDVCTWGKLPILVQCYRNWCRMARTMMMMIMMAME